MANTRILRFVDGDNNLRLDLNDPAGFEHGPIDLGQPGLEKRSLAGFPTDGERITVTRRTNALVTLPLILTPQPTWAAVDALFDALIVELERETNILQWQPIDAASSFLLDTYRADFLPSLFRGTERAADCILTDPQYITCQFERAPAMRGAGIQI